MTRKHDLRRLHAGMVLNLTSKKQESAIGQALTDVVERLDDAFGLELHHRSEWRVGELIDDLREDFPSVEFAEVQKRSTMKPDGGILSIVDGGRRHYPILIAEVKNQGTNDRRAAEGLAQQAKGNAIERLGKNVIGFRTGMLAEGIMPFVCFGYGCDFAEGSSILDRVVTIAMFGPLNRVSVVSEGERQQFNRGSYFFREEEWTVPEMADVMFDIASRSVHFYFAKYGDGHFRRLPTS